jgi:hypothetical protein
VSEADHWPAGPAPTPTLQKKPKELDKAMWVGNVLSDTTQEELRAIFEAEPTEEEGDIEHDVPEVNLISRTQLQRKDASVRQTVTDGYLFVFL